MKQTTLCYIERAGKYLMIHRTKKENDENKDKWIGIGGKLEEGESPFDGARREVFEETGLTVENLSYKAIITFVLDGKTEYMHLFHTSQFLGEVKEDCDEGELDWIDKSELLSLPLWEGDKIFLKLLDTEKRFYSLKLIYDKDGRLLSHVLEF